VLFASVFNTSMFKGDVSDDLNTHHDALLIANIPLLFCMKHISPRQLLVGVQKAEK